MEGLKQLTLTLAAFLVLCCSLAAQGTLYVNPVISNSTPDPSVINASDGKFYLFATENIRNVPVFRSDNLVDWVLVSTAFNEQTRPDFEPDGHVWAPDINFIGGRYVLYYSMSVWGGEWTCGIGVAVSDNPDGPFTDCGMMFRSNGIGIQNCIDPFYICDNGRHYLFWGSFHGIYGAQLSPDGLSLREGETPRMVAGTAYEGTYIHKRGGFYYLFASVGTCCEGLKSTYKMVVGRSRNLFGPYVDSKGKPMLENNHEVVLHKSNRFVGTGHNSEIVTDDKGHDWVLYHGFDVQKPQSGRVLLLSRVRWRGGWPYIDGDIPCEKGEAPFFRKK